MAISRVITWLAFAALFSLFVGFFSFYTGQGAEEKDVLIPRGLPIGKVGALLQEQGVISSPRLFKALALLSGGSRRIKAGEFSFKTQMGPANALLVLYTSEPIQHAVTIPPGWNARQIASLLAAEKLADPAKFLALVFSPSTVAKYKLHAPSLEGYLFPDTYTFSRIDSEDKIVERMVQEFFSRVDQALISTANARGLTLNQLVTLASIIEKETGVPSERELISSVFHNRLKKKMRLQSDPTTIYGIADFDGNLTRKHLTTPSAYNTYTLSGLPPGAIASPGLAALQATVNPAKSNYLYFVANNQGGHVFSETYAEHSRKVDMFQKRRASARQTESLRQLGATKE